MYDIDKKMFLVCPSVGNLISKLLSLPRDAKIRCCGSPCFYIHVDEGKSTICIDTESLADEYTNTQEEIMLDEMLDANN